MTILQHKNLICIFRNCPVMRNNNDCFTRIVQFLR